MSYQDTAPVETQMAAIAELLEAAQPYGLEVEAIREAMRSYREMDDPDIAQACTNALVEWDL